MTRQFISDDLADETTRNGGERETEHCVTRREDDVPGIRRAADNWQPVRRTRPKPAPDVDNLTLFES